MKKFMGFASLLILLVSCGGGGGDGILYEGSGSNTESEKVIIQQTGFAVDDVINGTVYVYSLEDLSTPVAQAPVQKGKFVLNIPNIPNESWLVCVEGTDGVNTFDEDNPLCGIYDFVSFPWFVNPLTDYIIGLIQKGVFSDISSAKEYMAQKGVQVKDSATDLNDAINYINTLKQFLGISLGTTAEWHLKLFKKLEMSSFADGDGVYDTLSMEVVNISHKGTATVFPAVNTTPVSFECPDETQNFQCEGNAIVDTRGEFAVLPNMQYAIFLVKKENANDYMILAEGGNLARDVASFYGLPCKLQDGSYAYMETNPFPSLTSCDFSSVYQNGTITCSFAIKVSASSSFMPPGETPSCQNAEISSLTDGESKILNGDITIKLGIY